MVLALASIFVLVGPVRKVWDGLAALPMALLVAPSTKSVGTHCIEGSRGTGEACSHVRTEALSCAVLVTMEDISKDLSGPATTACPPLCMAVVPLVAASTDTDKDTPPTTDPGADAGMGTTLAAFKEREREGQANIWATQEVVGLGSMVLVATEEEWVGLEALPMARPMLTGALNTAVLLAMEEVRRVGLLIVPRDHRADRLGDISTDCSTSRGWRHTDDGTR